MPSTQQVPHDDATADISGDPARLFDISSLLPCVLRVAHGISQRNSKTRLITTPPEIKHWTMSTNPPRGFSPLKPVPSANAGRKQQRPMPRSNLSQSEDGQQRETLEPPRQDDSLTSSSRFVRSSASYDFSNLDQLQDSINAPGIVRSAASNPSQQDFSTLPDEKSFTIQIGSELFKLSGASIISDGVSNQIPVFMNMD